MTPRAMEMEVTMVGLQNAGKTSLLRVLAVGFGMSFLVLDRL
jgi:shikimate kinase